MKKAIRNTFSVAILVMLVVVFGLQARTAFASENGLSGSAGVGYGHNASDSWLGWSKVDGSLGTAFATVKYEGAYASLQYVGANHDAHETIGTVGYARGLGYGFKGDLSYTYDTSNGIFGTTHRLAAVLDGPSFYGVTPFIGAGRWFSNNDSVLPDLWVTKAGLKASVDAAGQPINLSAHVAGFYPINSDVENRAFASAIFSADVPVEVVKNVFVTPYATWAVPSHYFANVVQPRFAWGVNASVKF